jgi:hypothetical protein
MVAFNFLENADKSSLKLTITKVKEFLSVDRVKKSIPEDPAFTNTIFHQRIKIIGETLYFFYIMYY